MNRALQIVIIDPIFNQARGDDSFEALSSNMPPAAKDSLMAPGINVPGARRGPGR